MAHEQDELESLRERMESLGVTDYEIRKHVVYLNGQDIGGIAYLNSRRMDQLVGILDRMKEDKE